MAAKELYKEDLSAPAKLLADIAGMDKMAIGRAKAQAKHALRKQERPARTGGEGGAR